MNLTNTLQLMVPIILLVNTYFILLIILEKLNSIKQQQSNLLVNCTLNLRTLKSSFNAWSALWHPIKCTKCTFCSSSATFHKTSMNLTPKFKIWSPTTHINRIVKLKASLSNPSSKYPSSINVVQVTTFFRCLHISDG